jgi:glycosyltransferase involved in cell wall biosynthesis
MSSKAQDGLISQFDMTATRNTYAIVTAAYNEERYIEDTVRSVVSQTLLPEKWVVVSDGSTDRTDEIVRQYATQYKFIQLHQITETHERNWSAQVYAINAGFAILESLNTGYIGNLDADITLRPVYFESLLAKFAAESDLGIAGGYIQELQDNEFRNRRDNNPRSVPHALQLFRRECFAAVNPYTPLIYGGPDWYAEILARMAGWTAKSFPDLPANHHRPTGSAGGFSSLVRYWYRQGKMDHGFGTLPSFELLKLARRLPSRPAVVGALARLTGYCVGHLNRQERLLPENVVSFLREEQQQRLRSFFGLRNSGENCTSNKNEQPAREDVVQRR